MDIDALHAIQQSGRKYEESVIEVSHAMKKCAVLADNFAETLRRHGLNIESYLRDASPQPMKRKHSEVDTNGTTTKATRTPKPKKDPNEPKRPASSYIMFQNFVRGELKEKGTTLSNSEQIALVKSQWQALSEAEKDVWNQKAKNDIEGWKKKKAVWDQEHPVKESSNGSPQIKSTSPKEKKMKEKAPKIDTASIKAAKPQSKKQAPPPPVKEDNSESESESESDETTPPVKSKTKKQSSSSEESSEESDSDDHKAVAQTVADDDDDSHESEEESRPVKKAKKDTEKIRKEKEKKRK